MSEARHFWPPVSNVRWSVTCADRKGKKVGVTVYVRSDRRDLALLIGKAALANHGHGRSRKYVVERYYPEHDHELIGRGYLRKVLP